MGYFAWRPRHWRFESFKRFLGYLVGYLLFEHISWHWTVFWNAKVQTNNERSAYRFWQESSVSSFRGDFFACHVRKADSGGMILENTITFLKSGFYKLFHVLVYFGKEQNPQGNAWSDVAKEPFLTRGGFAVSSRDCPKVYYEYYTTSRNVIWKNSNNSFIRETWITFQLFLLPPLLLSVAGGLLHVQWGVSADGTMAVSKVMWSSRRGHAMANSEKVARFRANSTERNE